jgi:hypothetical protein
MPAPLAMPATRTVTPATSKLAAAILDRVSVVMMAPAIFSRSAAEDPNPARNAGSAAVTFSTGNSTPMMPVDEGNTSCGAHPKTLPAMEQLCSAAAMPASPVAQLALPALMSATRTRC